jgi:hypothetical protein
MKSRRRNENLFNEFSTINSVNKEGDSMILPERNSNKEEEVDKILEFNEKKKREVRKY